MANPIFLLGVVGLVVSLFLIPLGLPGLWIMIGILAVALFYGEVNFGLFILLVILALAAELAEFLLVKRLSERYGGSKRAFWGALLGGLVGVVVGVPVPVVGSVVAGILGSFAGAAVVTYWETKRMGSSARVGWGAVLGRVFSTGAKMAAGAVIVALGSWSLLSR